MIRQRCSPNEAVRAGFWASAAPRAMRSVSSGTVRGQERAEVLDEAAAPGRAAARDVAGR